MRKVQLRHDYGRHVSNPFFSEDKKECMVLSEKKNKKKNNNEGALNYELSINPTNDPPKDKNIDDLIKNLSAEITILNYKNNPITTQDANQKRATIYFRSHTDKRLIGAFVTLRTFQKKCVTQKQVLDRFPHLKKPFVSLFFKHCTEEGWFTQKPTDLSKKIYCYEATEMLLYSVQGYYNFCVSSRNKLQFI